MKLVITINLDHVRSTNVDDVRLRVLSALRNEFDPEEDTDLTVTVEKHAD